MISFRFKTTHFDNQYDLYSRKFADGTSMIKGFDITVSYETVSGIVSLFIINEIQSTEGLIIFILDIFNAFQNTIWICTEEMDFLSLLHLYL